MENNVNNFQKNVVVFGLSGSGKDTIANHLEHYLDYFKIRIAGTIKQIIQEKYLLSETELEEAKRGNAEIREEHHNVGTYLDGFDGTINRVKMIISGKLLEFKYKQDHQQIVVCDGRGLEREVGEFLKHPDWVCIFLSRTNYDKEHRNEAHWTEHGSIENSLKFIKEFDLYDKSIIIINNKELTKLDEASEEIATKCLGYFNISEDATSGNLIAAVGNCIDNELI